jgi:uncharacterized protein YraI
MIRKLALGLALPLAAMLAGAVVAPLPAAADTVSRSTARATGTLPIRSGPGIRYTTIGYLPDGAAVHLRECTPRQLWCLIVNPDGPDGWVRASYLVGSPAKMQVTPQSPFLDDDFFWPNSIYDSEHPNEDPEE